ncbi:hypothetical protein [Nocardiopsis alba]|uniref:hypothetical protein n=1 Tax=Nocardiopsis alba TaxID=53437 RepID=UPI0033A249EA
MSMFDKIAKAVYGTSGSGQAAANDAEERRLVRAQLARDLQQAERELAASPDSKICKAGVESARQMLQNFDAQN